MLGHPEECIPEVSILPLDAFRCPRHRAVVEGIRWLHDQREPLGFLSIQDYLSSTRAIRLPEDAAWFTSILTEGAIPADLPRHVERIRKNHAAFRIRVACESTLQRLDAPAATLDPQAISQELQTTAFDAVGGLGNSSPESQSLEVLCMDAIENFESAIKNRGKILGIPSGLQSLDAITGGWRPGQLIILAARPSIGKSALAANFARNAADHVPVAFFSLEMEPRELVGRMICGEARVSLQAIQSASVSKPDQTRLNSATCSISQLPLHFDGTPAITLSALRNKARRLSAQKKIGLILIDYLQLMRAPSKKGEQYRHLEVAEITGGLKELAKELRIPIIALAQLNREVESRSNQTPRLADLRESGSIEQDADLVMLMHREKMRADEPTDLIIAKNRNGPTAKIQLRFDAPKFLFSENSV